MLENKRNQTLIAEIYNKAPRDYISKEDVLTGNFFGSLRYTKFDNILKIILSSVEFYNKQSNNEWINLLNSFKNNINLHSIIKFWPRYSKFGEIDLIFEFDNLVVGIEIKYNSGLSGETQLARYYNMLHSNFEQKHKYLVFIAPQNTIEVVKSIESVQQLFGQNNVGFLTWESILEILEDIGSFETNEIDTIELIILNDLIEYLRVLGFSVFKSMRNNIDCFNIINDQYLNFNFSDQLFSFAILTPIKKDISFIF